MKVAESQRPEEALRESERIARTTLDALSTHVAILDEQGTILDVNRAWRTFEQPNSTGDVRCCEGANYLSVCDAAHGKDSEEAAPFASGIRSVLRGDLNEFILEYPCHSPHEKRWFIGRVTRFPGEGAARIVIAHENITDRKQAEVKVKREQVLSSAIIDSIPGTFYMLDENGRYVRWNSYQRDEIIGKPENLIAGSSAADTIHPDDRDFIQSKIASVLRGGKEETVEGRVLLRGGPAFRWLLMTGRPMTVEGHSFLVGTGIDITEHKQEEETLRESEERYRCLFETMSQGVVYQSADGQILSANPAAERILGLSLEQMKGKTSLDSDWCAYREDGSVLPGQEHPAMVALRTGKPVERFLMSVKNAHKQEQTWIMVTSTPLVQPGEKLPFQVYTTFDDVTAQRLAEQDYRTLFREMLDGFALHEIVLDGSGNPIDYRFLTVNPAFEKMTGLKAEEIVGRTAREVIPNLELHWIETYGKVALTGEPVFFENCADELKMHFEVTAFRPAPNKFACIFSDITERKQAEAEREKLGAQLLQAQKMEAVGRLAGGVAHDFNNMLGIISGHVELAMMSVSSSDPIYADLEQIQKAGIRSADLTRQLLAFARKQTISPQVLDLNETVEGTLKMLRRLIGEDISLSWNPSRELWLVKIDPVQIDQILANLCVNARDAINGIGKLIMETANVIFDEVYCANHAGFVAGAYVALVVSDDGCGMDKATLLNAFEPFFTTKAMGKGTGLGLSTVYGIVKQNNGFINLYSEPGKGTTFRIYLPRHRGKTVAAPGEKPTESYAGGAETILLVEDEWMILQLGKTILERLGYKVLAANSPAEAIRLAATYVGPIHLLVTDVIMPEMNGRELAQTLSSSDAGLKCLFTSGYTANAIAHHGVLEEGVYFIQKPFSIKDLDDKVREALDGTRRPASRSRLTS